MATGAPGKKTALRTHVVWAALLGSGLAMTACSGVEADVLSLRPLPDLATADVAAPGMGDGATPGCQTQTLSMKECFDLPAWTPMAKMVCASLGGLLPGRMTLTAPCPMNGAQGLRFECCPAPVCTEDALGDAMSCYELQDLVTRVTTSCQLRGQTVSSISFIDLCDTRHYRMVKYLCCAPSPPLPTGP